MSNSSAEVSVILQRAFNPGSTPFALTKARDALPKAEIIRSIRAHPKFDLLRNCGCDALIVSEDPGGHPVINVHCKGQRKLISNNVNRKMISTRVGLAQATRRYRTTRVRLRRLCLRAARGRLWAQMGGTRTDNAQTTPTTLAIRTINLDKSA